MTEKEMLRKLLYCLFRREIRRLKMRYDDIGKEIGYSVITVRCYMSSIKNGRRGSRFVEQALIRSLIAKEGMKP